MLRTSAPLALILLSGSVFAQTFDPAADFSPTTNSGTWTYGSLPTGGSFTPHTNTWTKAGTDVRGWIGTDYAGGDGYTHPFVMKNTGSTAATVVAHYGQGYAFTLQPGQLAMGGSGYLRSVLRFTAPETGFYSVDGSFTKLMNTTSSTAETSSNVAIARGGTTLHSAVLIGGQGTSSAFSLGLISLAAGEALDFTVFDGTNAAFNSTGLQATVVANPVPEPATFAVIGLGVAALARRRRRAV